MFHCPPVLSPLIVVLQEHFLEEVHYLSSHDTKLDNNDNNGAESSDDDTLDK